MPTMYRKQKYQPRGFNFINCDTCEVDLKVLNKKHHNLMRSELTAARINFGRKAETMQLLERAKLTVLIRVKVPAKLNYKWKLLVDFLQGTGEEKSNYNRRIQ